MGHVVKVSAYQPKDYGSDPNLSHSLVSSYNISIGSNVHEADSIMGPFVTRELK